MVISNSIKHGLTAKNLIVGEDQAEFENYRDQMLDALKPSGIFEEQVVFKIIDVGFRLRRVFSIESGLFNQEILTHEIDEYKTKVTTSFEADTEDILVLNADKSSRVKGLAFARDANHGSSLLSKLNTIEDKLLNKYFKLMDIYKDMKGVAMDWRKNRKIILQTIAVDGEIAILEKRSQIIVIL